MAKSRGGNYAHSGNFSRLAGHPTAPGSWQKSRFFWQWKLLYVLLGGSFITIGLFFMLF